MFVLTNEEVEEFRGNLRASEDRNLTVDVGYFLIWYAAAELSFTNLLAFVSGVDDLTTFDYLCSGMDFRVKIERFRRIQALNGGIGPKLDSRLKYLNDKCRPIRNRFAHCALTRAADNRRYLASTLSTMPWADTGMTPPQGVRYGPPVVYTPNQILGWGAWLAAFGHDVTDAHQTARLSPRGTKIEIVNPRSPEPPASQETPAQ